MVYVKSQMPRVVDACFARDTNELRFPRKLQTIRFVFDSCTIRSTSTMKNNLFRYMASHQFLGIVSRTNRNVLQIENSRIVSTRRNIAMLMISAFLPTKHPEKQIIHPSRSNTSLFGSHEEPRTRPRISYVLTLSIDNFYVYILRVV